MAHARRLGQTLSAFTAGIGWVQREGEPVEEIRPDDVVWREALAWGHGNHGHDPYRHSERLNRKRRRRTS
jgi:hypothetical protein